jgi:peptidoglycan/xylan/chitin deacetylase (PgdA/CDA1 family)
MKLISASLNRYYHTMQNKHPNILWFGDESRREIALTFDDGPHPKDTPQVLDMLAKHNIYATFFLVGKYVDKYPELVKQIHQSGHQLGIHGYRHRPFQLENPATLRAQLERTRNLIADICNSSPELIRTLRPPYGAFTQKTISALTEWGYQLVMWNNIPPHWMQPLNWTISQIFDRITPGSIIVLHDGHEHGRNVSSILDTIIPRLKASGYSFIKIEDMKRNRLNE